MIPNSFVGKNTHRCIILRHVGYLAYIYRIAIHCSERRHIKCNEADQISDPAFVPTDQSIKPSWTLPLGNKNLEFNSRIDSKCMAYSSFAKCNTVSI